MNLRPHIEHALAELSVNSLNDIQRETALVWAGRAVAARMRGQRADAMEYAHESLEHAGLTGDDALLRSVRDVFTYYGIEW